MRGKFVAALTITGFWALLLVGCGQKAGQKTESGGSNGASTKGSGLGSQSGHSRAGRLDRYA